MRASLLVCVILATVFFLNVSASNSSSSEEGFDSPVGYVLTRSKTKSRRSQACRRNVKRNCSSTTKTCARLGRANICQAFKNDCQRQLSNCGSKKCECISSQKGGQYTLLTISIAVYRKVDVALCRGLPIDVVRPCGSGNNWSQAWKL